MVYWKPTRPILMTADPIGGVWNYALELCRQLGAADISVALATMGRRLSASERATVRNLPNAKLFESDYKLDWMADPWEDLNKSSEWLLDLQALVQPSLIHLNGYYHGALRWNVPCLMVGHSCVYSWFEAVKGTPPSDEWRRYKQRVTIGLRGADLVTAPSQFMLAMLQKHYGSFAAGDPVYNGRSATDFRPAIKEEFILTAGRLWDEAKNIAILQSVAGKLSWPIYAAGEGKGPDGKNPAIDGLIPIGRLDSATLAQWLSRAAIFVLPARYEPFGLSALEAALAGCALVLGNIPSLQEIWRDAALFVPADNPDAVTAALLTLVEDSALRNDLSQRARTRALSFTPERMAEGYLHLYEKLLSAQIQTVRGDLVKATKG